MQGRFSVPIVQDGDSRLMVGSPGSAYLCCASCQQEYGSIGGLGCFEIEGIDLLRAYVAQDQR